MNHDPLDPETRRYHRLLRMMPPPERNLAVATVLLAMLDEGEQFTRRRFLDRLERVASGAALLAHLPPREA